MVFGGTSGINLGIADGFARSGARVSVASRKQENIDAAVRVLRIHGNDVLGLQADVRDFESVGRAFEAAHQAFGPIDVLVSGAAGNFLADFNALSPNGFKVVIDIDLNGTFHVLRQAFPYLRRPGASVINITAPQASVPIRGQVHVCAAKAGVDQVTRVLALEWGGEGIRVNAISPGLIKGTGGMQRLTPSEVDSEKQLAPIVPLGRLGAPEDIANLAMFLSSQQASYISGAIVPCDGGGAIESVKPGIELAARYARERATR